MPSANPKLEKQASTEATEPIRQAITVVEHKIRNLEKRKGRLESYRDIVKNGGELNADQKTAVAKYDEVIQTLEMMRELCKQMIGIANDAAKQQKKLARKEALERMQQDISKVREVLLIQDTLMNLGTQTVRNDFINGLNGAIKLAEEDIKFLDSLYNEVMLKHERLESEPSFLQQAQKVAEHYVLIVDGKQREVVGTTYSKLKEIITSITQCGYFDQVQEAEVTVEEVTQVIAETQITNTHAPEQISEDFNNTERHIPVPSQPENLLPIQTFPVPVAAIPVVSGTSPIPAAIPVVAQPIQSLIPQAPVDASYYTNATFVPSPQVQPQQHQQQPPQQQPGGPAPRINDVIGPAPNFFFLQESELDTPEVAASQAPPVVSHIPSAPTVVAAAVTLNTHIPTQTFTNQSFAAPHVVPTQVMYQHQSQDISHLPAFGTSNPPPPIPMPPSHQTSMQFGQQNSNSFLQSQTFEQSSQEPLMVQKEEIHENLNKNENNESASGEVDMNGPTDWAQATETSGDWSQVDPLQQSTQDSQQLQNSQTWGSDQQRNSFRGRGRRGNSNGYNNRGRGNYQQNGRGTYYRNNDGNYQNGYQRNWNNSNEGNGGYNPGFKRSNGNGGPRGGLRGENRGMDRGGRGGGGQFRGNQRGANNRTGYAPRGKPQAQN